MIEILCIFLSILISSIVFTKITLNKGVFIKKINLNIKLKGIYLSITFKDMKKSTSKNY